MMGKGVCPLLILNIYWIQLVALQSFASFPHSSDKAFTLLEGAWTSLQALYMAEKCMTVSHLQNNTTESMTSC